MATGHLPQRRDDFAASLAIVICGLAIGFVAVSLLLRVIL